MTLGNFTYYAMQLDKEGVFLSAEIISFSEEGNIITMAFSCE